MRACAPRTQRHRPRSPRTWLHAAGALLLGALTHLIWDGFTHENAPGVRMFPVLDELRPEIAGHSVQLYRLAAVRQQLRRVSRW